MGQQVSITELKEQIEAAKRGLAEISPVITATEPLSLPVATTAENFAGLTAEHEDDAADVSDQNIVADDDMATGDMTSGDEFQFFHRPKRSDQPSAPLSPMSITNADISARGDDQPLLQAFDQRLDRLESAIAQNHTHILELITLLSGLDTAAKSTRRNVTSVKHSPRRNLYWFVIGFMVIGWVALTPSGHYWINYFLGLI